MSRIDPTLLGVKYASSFTKNTLYLHGSSTPLLCFSVVLVTCDNHEQGHIFGSDPKEYVIKDIAGVLLTMELECFISVLGLAYDLLHVPDDSARKEQDLLHISMIDNAFSLFFFLYTVSTYSAPSGLRVNLNIHFSVVLHEPLLESVSHDDEEDSVSE